MSESPMTAQDIVAALAKRHPAPTWAFLEQVRNSTGWAKVPRTADAIAMSCWPSRGLELHGFEVKVSRTDWKRELADPEKAEEIMAFCDRWWIVTPAKGIVQDGEIPTTWGHMVVDGRGATVKIAAPKLEAQPIDRLFLAAILRRVNECSIPVDRIEDKIKAARSEGKDEASHGLRYSASEHASLIERVRKFEKASGLSIEHGWEKPETIGAAVRQVLEKGPLEIRKEMEQHRAWLAAQLKEADAYLSETA